SPASSRFRRRLRGPSPRHTGSDRGAGPRRRFHRAERPSQRGGPLACVPFYGCLWQMLNVCELLRLQRVMRLSPARVSFIQMRLLSLLALLGCRATPPDGVPTIEMPDNDPGIGFDDMRFSRARGVILVPGGRSGYLDLVDPVTRRVDPIDGFSREIFYFGGGYQGATSADDGPDGLIYVSDRTPEKLHVVDPIAHAIIA